MSMPNFGNQSFCKYRQSPQQNSAATYVIDVSKAFLGSLVGCLLALALWSEIVQYRMKAKVDEAMQEAQRNLQQLRVPRMPQ